MATVKSGINSITDPVLTIGSGSSVDGYIYINNASPSPYLRHNTSEWVVSNNGTTEFSLISGVTVHNNLSGIQGGGVDGYYHITPGEHQFVIDGYNGGNFNDGYQLSTDGTNILWEPGYYNALFVGKLGIVAGATNGYLLPNLAISSDENFPAFITPIQSRVTNMIVSMSQAPGNEESVTVTLRENGSDTPLSVTVSNTDTSGSNTDTL